MDFHISLGHEVLSGSTLGNAAIAGEIVIGDHRELFEAFIGFWGPADYQAQWIEGCRRAAWDDRPSCLITSITDPAQSEYLRWWLLYPDRDVIFIQEAILLLRSTATPFSTHDPYVHIPPHRRRTEEGFDVSEWTISRDAVKAFVLRAR